MPIYPVGLGCEEAPPQAAILAVKAPPAVYKDASAGVDVRFRVAGLQKQDVVLELYRGAGKEKTLLEKRTIHHDGKDREYAGELSGENGRRPGRRRSRPSSTPPT